MHCNSSGNQAIPSFLFGIFQHNNKIKIDWKTLSNCIVFFCCFYSGVSMTPTTRLLYCFKESPAEVNDYILVLICQLWSLRKPPAPVTLDNFSYNLQCNSYDWKHSKVFRGGVTHCNLSRSLQNDNCRLQMGC